MKLNEIVKELFPPRVSDDDVGHLVDLFFVAVYKKIGYITYRRMNDMTISKDGSAIFATVRSEFSQGGWETFYCRFPVKDYLKRNGSLDLPLDVDDVEISHVDKFKTAGALRIIKYTTAEF